MAQTNDQSHVSVNEFATRVGYSPDHVRFMLRTGKLKGERVGERGKWKIPVSAVELLKSGAGAGAAGPVSSGGAPGAAAGAGEPGAGEAAPETRIVADPPPGSSPDSPPGSPPKSVKPEPEKASESPFALGGAILRMFRGK